MRKSILLKIIFFLFTITIFINCKNEISKPNIVKITPEKYLNLKKGINKKIQFTKSPYRHFDMEILCKV